jgi:hypothetical protein
MPAPTVKVEIGLDLGINDPDTFILDDLTRGVLDNTDFTLSGDRFFDITDRIISTSTNRGKNEALDRIDAGVASIVVDNSDRVFDPLYPNGPYFGQLIPRRSIRISCNEQPVFRGLVEDFEIVYQPSNKSQVRIDVADAFSLLTNANLTAFTPSSELSGARINAVLDRPEVSWLASQRDIDTGDSTMMAAPVAEGTSALTYLQLVSSSEFGDLFIGKDGKVNFRERNAIPNSPDLVFSDEVVAGEFTGIHFVSVNNVYGSENLYNRITIENATSPELVATADDAESELLYGPRSFSATGLLVEEQSQLDFLADYLLARFKEPEYRFNSVTVILDDLTTEKQDDVLDLEIGQIVEVRFTPSGIPPAIEQYCRIIGISHDWDSNSKIVNFALERLDFSIFILDDAVFGVLDSDRLSF